jgi:hypothetical protein
VANTPCLKIRLKFKDAEAQEKHGYPEGQVYTVQAKAWMDERNVLDLVDIFLASIESTHSSNHVPTNVITNFTKLSITQPKTNKNEAQQHKSTH